MTDAEYQVDYEKQTMIHSWYFLVFQYFNYSHLFYYQIVIKECSHIQKKAKQMIAPSSNTQ